MGLVRICAILFAVLLARPALAQADAAGVACRAPATRAEKIVCTDTALAADNAAMAALYDAAQTSAFGSGTSNIAASQREWRGSLDGCTAPEKDGTDTTHECLAGVYRERLEALGVAALFARPELALATLRRVDPRAAPLYEAIWLYASASPGQEPKERIAPLIAPFLADPADPNAYHWGLDMLRDDGLVTPDKVLETEADFATFVQRIGPYVEGATYPLPMPCAAIVRRPGLLAATDPGFGSSLDNGVLSPDCAQTLPAMPRVDALVNALWRAWPECDGTMRFAYYRSFSQSEVAARLGIESDDAAPAKQTAPGATPALIAGATYELSSMYRQYLGLSLPDSRARAQAAVSGMLATAGTCDMDDEDAAEEPARQP